MLSIIHHLCLQTTSKNIRYSSYRKPIKNFSLHFHRHPRVDTEGQERRHLWNTGNQDQSLSPQPQASWVARQNNTLPQKGSPLSRSTINEPLFCALARGLLQPPLASLLWSRKTNSQGRAPNGSIKVRKNELRVHQETAYYLVWVKVVFKRGEANEGYKKKG